MVESNPGRRPVVREKFAETRERMIRDAGEDVLEPGEQVMKTHFIPSPNPAPGDLRRLASLDVREEVGKEETTSHITTEYQTVQGFHIPRRITVGAGGSQSLAIGLSDCSALR
jgi:hypothetical protein